MDQFYSLTRLDELALSVLLKCESGKLKQSVGNLIFIQENLHMFEQRLQFLFHRKLKNKPHVVYCLLSDKTRFKNNKLLVRSIRNLLSQCRSNNLGEVLDDLKYLLKVSSIEKRLKFLKRPLNVEIPVNTGPFILENLNELPELVSLLKQNFQISKNPVTLWPHISGPIHWRGGAPQ